MQLRAISCRYTPSRFRPGATFSGKIGSVCEGKETKLNDVIIGRMSNTYFDYREASTSINSVGIEEKYRMSRKRKHRLTDFHAGCMEFIDLLLQTLKLFPVDENRTEHFCAAPHHHSRNRLLRLQKVAAN